MSEDKYPSVYVVDSHASRPPIPPRVRPRPQRSGPAQILLFLLVSMALCGMAIEACFIYHLYRSESSPSASSSRQTADKDPPSSGEDSSRCPPKPLAHLSNVKPDENKHIVQWGEINENDKCKIQYSDGKLLIPKEGYYYIYSMLNFHEFNIFYHMVQRNTSRHSEPITLLQSRRYLKNNPLIQSSSFLGGVFHLYMNDSIFVNVSSVSHIVIHKSYENTFGAYMI